LNKSLADKRGEENAERSAIVAKREENLKKISSELLKGSVLLQESCPACNSPLVDSKNDPGKQMYCASCEKPVVRESEMKNRVSSVKAANSSRDVSNVSLPPFADINSLISIVSGKLESQIIKLAGEEDLMVLEVRTKVIDRLVNLLHTLKNM